MWVAKIYVCASTNFLRGLIHMNDGSVKRSGFCAVCRKVGGEYSAKLVKRGIKE